MTNETLKNPSVVVTPNPIGIDKAIASIQARLGTLTWLGKCFGRAWAVQRDDGQGKKRIEPIVYQGGTEYYPVLPNDALKSYSFFTCPGPRNTENYAPNVAFGTYFFSDPVSIIFWLNLKAIDGTKDYIFKEELLQSVLNQLNRDPNVTVGKVWDDKVEDIFKGFALYPEHRDLLMYPFAAFRIDMTLRYEFACQ